MEPLRDRLDQAVQPTPAHATGSDGFARNTLATHGLAGCDDNVLTAIGDHLGARGRARLACVGNRRIRDVLTASTAPAPQRWLRETAQEMQHTPRDLQRFLAGLPAERISLACESSPLFAAPVAVQGVQKLVESGRDFHRLGFGLLREAYCDLALQANLVLHLATIGCGGQGDLFAYQWRSLVAVRTYRPEELRYEMHDPSFPMTSNPFPLVWRALRNSFVRSEVVDLRVTAQQIFPARADRSLAYNGPGVLSDDNAFQAFVRSNLDRGLDVFMHGLTTKLICSVLQLGSARLRILRLNWADLYAHSEEQAEQIGLWAAECPLLEELDLVGRQRRCHVSVLGHLQKQWFAKGKVLPSLQILRLNLFGTLENEARQLEIMARKTREYLPSARLLDLHLPNRSEYHHGLLGLKAKFAGWPPLTVNHCWFEHPAVRPWPTNFRIEDGRFCSYKDTRLVDFMDSTGV